MTQIKLVALSGDCTVSYINHSYKALLEAFDSEGSIVIDLSQVEAADVTLVQLLVSASKTAAFQNRAFSLSSVPNRIQGVLGSSGVSFNLQSGQVIN